ncbi:hypothetical protein OC844_004661 [Tilletia horrida]|nr:hypothetical protein OC844_004661 [Tilletia horrida]
MTDSKFADWKAIKPSSLDVATNDREMILVYNFLFDGRLDLDKLTQAWAKLCQTWPILSARLRKGANPKSPADWRYLVPPDAEVQAVVEEDMSASCPAERRSLVVDEIDSKIRDFHPFVEGRDLPQDRPTIHPAARVIDSKANSRSKLMLLFASNAALSIDHLFTEDRPVAAAKITRFTDGTSIGLALPHVLCDGPGASEVMRAWAAIANGEGAKIAPLPDLGEDPFAPLAPGGRLAREEVDAAAQSGQKELSPPVGWHAFGLLDTLSLLVNFTWDVVWARPEATMEFRDIFLPSKYLAEQKAAAMAEIMGNGASAAAEGEYVSTSDVIVAVALKRLFAADARGPDDKRLVSFMYAANLRWLSGVSGSVKLPEPYLHNATHTVILPDVPIGHLVHGSSVGALALALRRAILRDSKPEAIRRSLVWRLANAQKLIAFFRPSSFYSAGTNWRAMKLSDISFTNALDSQSSSSATGRPFRVMMQPIFAMPTRNLFVILADDPAGGTWVRMTLSAAQWAQVERKG